ncbi:PIN domain-containing protein [Lysobacter silvisoli]|nr:PIN domain-containing protein [Lysobacter silvisoli]
MTQNVFIDANKIIQFGHAFDSAEASTLRDLIEVDILRVVTTDLTISEVAKRFAKVEMDKLQDICRPDLRVRAKRYLDLDIPEIDRDELRGRIFEEHHGRVVRFLREELRALVLNIDSVSPSQILDDYTHGRGMFSLSSKKDQFPDAFILAALLEGVSEINSLIILSGDHDFLPAVSNVAHVKLVENFERLLEVLGVAPAGDEALDLLDRFEAEFNDSVGEALQDYIIYSEDVEDGELEVQSVRDATLDRIRVYTSKKSKGTYLVYARVSCKAEVSFNHPDWESAIYDSEDKVLFPFETVEGEKEVDIDDVPFSFVFEYDRESDEATISNATVLGGAYVSATLYPPDWY